MNEELKTHKVPLELLECVANEVVNETDDRDAVVDALNKAFQEWDLPHLAVTYRDPTYKSLVRVSINSNLQKRNQYWIATQYQKDEFGMWCGPFETLDGALSQYPRDPRDVIICCDVEDRDMLLYRWNFSLPLGGRWVGAVL